MRVLALLLGILVAVVGFASASEQWPDLTGETVNVVALWSGEERRNFEAVLAEFSALTGAEGNLQPNSGKPRNGPGYAG